MTTPPRMARARIHARGTQGPLGPQGLFPSGAWSNATAYPKRAVVTHANSIWICLRNGGSTGVEPGTNSDHWQRWIDGSNLPEAVEAATEAVAARDAIAIPLMQTATAMAQIAAIIINRENS